MPRFQVKDARGGHSPVVVHAAYYKHEEGWTTFKDDSHKVLYDIPDMSVGSIERLPDLNTTEHHLVELDTPVGPYCIKECTGRGQHARGNRDS